VKGSLLLIVGIAVVLSCAADSIASDVTISASIDIDAVPVGNEVTLVVTVKGKFRKTSDPELPPLEDFSVYQAGTSQSFSFGTGGTSSSLQFKYILVPKKPGVYSIEPIQFRVGDKVYTANPVQLEVVKAASSMPAPGTLPGQAPKAVDDGGGGRPIFVSAAADKDTVFVNEQVTWTMGFFTDGRIDLMRSPEYSPPSGEGFWIEDLPPQKNYYRQIEGRQYLVNEIKRGFFAMAPGEYRIGAARVDLVIDDLSRTSRDRTFDDFFNRRFSSFGFGKPVSLKTNEIAVTVMPLPEAGQPTDFSGLVGRNLEVTLRADKNVAQVGEPVNVVVEIRGEGNFKTMSAPDLPALRDFKMYESGTASDLFKKDYVVSGRKRYEYVLIPKVEGNRTIPPVRMSYFDPVEKGYEFAQSAPIHLEIMPGTEEEGRRVIFAGSGEEIEVLGRDINHIHPVPAVFRAGGPTTSAKRLYGGLHALPLIALAVSVVVERRRRRFQQNISLARASRAARGAQKTLGKARTLHKKGRFGDVYPVVSEAIRMYFADKMNVSASGLTEGDIEGFLARRGVDDGGLDDLNSVLRTCDSAQYAPGASGELDAVSAGGIIERASELLKVFEKRYLS
jgi:hypothetical protein